MNKMTKLIEITQWSDKMIEWQTGLYLSLSDTWNMRSDELRAEAIRKYICKKKYAEEPQEFIEQLAKEEQFNPIIAGAILTELICKDSIITYKKLDLTLLQKPISGIGLGVEGGSIKIKGNIGRCAFEKAKNSHVSIEGIIGDRFAARSSNLNACIQGDVGELYGWQSKDLYSHITGDIFGMNVYRESNKGSIVLNGNILSKDFGCKAHDLKARILGNAAAQGHMRDSTDSRVIFHNNTGKFFAEQASGLDATVFGDIDGLGFARYGALNTIRCAGKINEFKSILGEPSQSIIYIPINRELSEDELKKMPQHIIIEGMKNKN